MEHRHGHRRAVDVPVTVSTRTGLAGTGRIEEASASGARLETALPLRLHSVIVLSLAALDARHLKHLKLEAEVVRRTESGFGIEWTQFAPSRLRVLHSYAGLDAPHAMSSTSAAVRSVGSEGRHRS
jgi:hypothetical protein